MMAWRLITVFVLTLGSLSVADPSALGLQYEEGNAPMNTDPLEMSPEERAELEAGQEKIGFQAEVNRLMDIIINSLYTNRDIFLRELISNAADAIDKIRFRSLTEKGLIEEDEELDVRISFDKEAKTITVTDKGIGMTKDDLKNNLGIVAKSGTTDFLNAATGNKEDNLSLIGQFGVGFYSVYLVADKVTVISKNPNDEQYIWESTANDVFSIAKDPRGNTLGRGTSIILQLKEDAEEFLNEKEIEDIVTRYSQFINFPIKLKTSRKETKMVPDEDAEDSSEDDDTEQSDDDMEVSEEEDEDSADKKDEPKMKEVTEYIEEWKTMNAAKPLWTRDPKDITDEEYEEFYKTVNPKNYADGILDKIHFLAEGEISFRALLYIPNKADNDQYAELFDMKKSGIKLYVRRVLISDEFEDLLPKYLSFIKGVVDSDDLPLNVSRETLSQSRVLRVIGKKLTRKVLDSLRKMSQAAEETDAASEEDSEKSEDDEDVEDVNDEAAKYDSFWEEHGKGIKFGVIDDRKNKGKLIKLLRYQTSASEGKAISIETYVERMKEDQKFIYYISGESLAKVENSPFLEKVTKKGYEVIYMTEPIDEYVVQSMTEFDGIELSSVTKDGLKLGSEDKKTLKKMKEEFKPLTEWMKDVYGSRVNKVQVTNRLTKTPCAVVSAQYGYSSNLARILKGATLAADNSNLMNSANQRILEINPYHPIIKEMFNKVQALQDEGEEDKSLEDLSLLLLDSAALQAGFTVDDYAEFSGRMHRVVSTGLDLDPDAEVPEEPEDEEEEEEEEEDTEEVEQEDDVEEATDDESPAHEEL